MTADREHEDPRPDPADDRDGYTEWATGQRTTEIATHLKESFWRGWWSGFPAGGLAVGILGEIVRALT